MPLLGPIESTLATIRGWIVMGDPIEVTLLWLLAMGVTTGMVVASIGFDMAFRRWHPQGRSVPRGTLLPQVGRYKPSRVISRRLSRIFSHNPFSIPRYGWRAVVTAAIAMGPLLLEEALIWEVLTLAVQRDLVAPVVAIGLGSLVGAAGSSNAGALNHLLVIGPVFGSLWLAGHGDLAMATFLAIFGGATVYALVILALVRVVSVVIGVLDDLPRVDRVIR